MLTYEQAVEKWARKTFADIPAEAHTFSIDTEVDFGGGCETCGYGRGEVTYELWYKIGTISKYRDIGNDFGAIIRGIVEQ